MNLKKAEQLTNKYLTLHLPDSGWSFKWDNAIGRLGVCKYKSKTISLSKRWVASLPESEVIDTILHEIAHAIAGFKAHHGYKWKQACIKLGAKPIASVSNLDVKISDIALPTHKLVDKEGTVYKEYYRKPSLSTYKKLPYLYIEGKKSSTLGKLRIEECSLLSLL